MSERGEASVDRIGPAAQWQYQPSPGLSDDLAAWRSTRFNERLSDHDRRVPGWSLVWGRFVSRIATLTGAAAEVVIPPDYEDLGVLERLAGEAALFGPPTELIELTANQCHANALALALAAARRWHVGTGFAGRLAGPVVEWRRHSWCVVPSTGEIVETTAAHFDQLTRYVGLILDADQARSFVPNLVS